jgi:hypothetical protein
MYTSPMTSSRWTHTHRGPVPMRSGGNPTGPGRWEPTGTHRDVYKSDDNQPVDSYTPWIGADEERWEPNGTGAVGTQRNPSRCIQFR